MQNLTEAKNIIPINWNNNKVMGRIMAVLQGRSSADDLSSLELVGSQLFYMEQILQMLSQSSQQNYLVLLHLQALTNRLITNVNMLQNKSVGSSKELIWERLNRKQLEQMKTHLQQVAAFLDSRTAAFENSLRLFIDQPEKGTTDTRTMREKVYAAVNSFSKHIEISTVIDTLDNPNSQNNTVSIIYPLLTRQNLQWVYKHTALEDIIALLRLTEARQILEQRENELEVELKNIFNQTEKGTTDTRTIREKVHAAINTISNPADIRTLINIIDVPGSIENDGVILRILYSLLQNQRAQFIYDEKFPQRQRPYSLTTVLHLTDSTEVLKQRQDVLEKTGKRSSPIKKELSISDDMSAVSSSASLFSSMEKITAIAIAAGQIMAATPKISADVMNNPNSAQIVNLPQVQTENRTEQTIQSKGGIDLSNIEITLKDEKFVSSLNPADQKIILAAKALKQGFAPLSLLRIYEAVGFVEDKIVGKIENKELLLQVLDQLKVKTGDSIDDQLLQFSVTKPSTDMSDSFHPDALFVKP